VIDQVEVADELDLPALPAFGFQRKVLVAFLFIVL